MDKKQVQDQELKQVSGGSLYDTITSCPSCGKSYYYDRDYPDGFYVKEESDGCGGVTYYYKCPNCSHEWTE